MKNILKTLAVALCMLPGALLADAQTLPDDSLKVRIAEDVTDYLKPMMKMRSDAKVISIERGKKESIKVTFGGNLTDFSYRANTIDAIKDIIKGYIPAKQVEIFVDKTPVEDLATGFYIGKKYKMPKKSAKLKGAADERYKLVTPLSRPYSITKGLQKNHIAMWQSHGWYYDQPLMRWEWQRARIFQTVEDLYTQSYVLPFILPMLENAGATVLLPRERDPKSIELIADNDGFVNAPTERLYSETEGTKSWKTGEGEGFAFNKAVFEGNDNPFKMGTYRVVEAIDAKEIAKGAKESLAKWSAKLPVNSSDEYAVYVSYKSLPNSTPAAKYIVKHNGGEQLFSVNQQMGGGTWICLGSFSFDSNDSEQGVYLSNVVADPKLAAKKYVVTADAVKIGGGMGNVARYPSLDLEENKKSSSAAAPSAVEKKFVAEPQVSGYARVREGARYWLQYAGFADSVYTYSGMKNDYNDDYMSRGLWVNALMAGSSKNPGAHGGYNIPVDLSFGFHTDAGTYLNDSIVGTLSIYTRYSKERDTYLNGESRLLGREFADIIQTQLVEDVRALYEPKWGRRQLWDRSYAESRIPEVPGVLLEFLSHQNFADMKYGLDPSFRFTASRAIYKAMLKFLAYKNGTDYVVQPLPVKNFAAELSQDSKSVHLSWEPVEDPLEPTATPKQYLIYTRVSDVKSFDDGILVEGTSADVKIEPGKIYSYKVVAVNEGGASFPSEILSVGVSANRNAKRIMIVNGFDRIAPPAHFQSKDSTYAGFNNRYDSGVPYMRDYAFIGEQYEFNRALEWRDDDAPGFGASHSDYENRIVAGNTFDYPVVHGRPMLNAGYTFVSSSVGAVKSGRVSIKGYHIVDFIMGKQCQTKVGFGNHPVKYEVFPAELRSVITDYAKSGGNILVSGCYVATDLWDAINVSEEGKSFAKDILKFKWMTHSATKQGKVKVVSNPFGFVAKGDACIEFPIEQNEKSYSVDAPDAFTPVGENAYTVFRYINNISAGVAYKGNDYSSLVLGFPIETVLVSPENDGFMEQILKFFEK